LEKKSVARKRYRARTLIARAGDGRRAGVSKLKHRDR
jgi:hypothetical protein